MQIKKTYLKKEMNESKLKKDHDNEIEKCDKNFTKSIKREKIKQLIIRRK